jgi:hypothetical protein
MDGGEMHLIQNAGAEEFSSYYNFFKLPVFNFVIILLIVTV